MNSFLVRVEIPEGYENVSSQITFQDFAECMEGWNIHLIAKAPELLDENERLKKQNAEMLELLETLVNAWPVMKIETFIPHVEKLLKELEQ